MLPFQRQPIVAALTLMLLSGEITAAAEEDAVTRGEYLVHAGGCFSCHTVAGGEKLAGGRALATPFGTFYSPNITPDPQTGIGRWTDAQFLRALREGVRPDGANYFPVFPYPSFTGITDGDALAIRAYLFSLPPAMSVISSTTVIWGMRRLRSEQNQCFVWGCEGCEGKMGSLRGPRGHLRCGVLSNLKKLRRLQTCLKSDSYGGIQEAAKGDLRAGGLGLVPPLDSPSKINPPTSQNRQSSRLGAVGRKG